MTWDPSTNFAQVMVAVDDLDATAEFYTGLGLREIVPDPELGRTYRRFTDHGDYDVVITTNPEATAGESRPVHEAADIQIRLPQGAGTVLIFPTADGQHACTILDLRNTADRGAA